NLDVADFSSKVNRLITAEESEDEKTDILIKTALEKIDEANPDWTYSAGRIYAHQLYRHAAAKTGYHAAEKYVSFIKLIVLVVEEIIYSQILLEKYKHEDIDYFQEAITPERDELFHYLALHTLATRYLSIDHEMRTYELPQERWMIIAMHLMQDEAEDKRNE